MRTFILGAGGFIAAYVAKTFSEKGEVFGYDIKKRNWKVEELFPEVQIKRIGKREISDYEFDQVYLLAGFVNPLMYATNRKKVIESCLLSLIETCKLLRGTPKVTYASSSEIYGKAITEGENSPMVFSQSGRWCYAMAKKLGEDWLSEERFEYRIFRLFNVSGPGIESRVITLMIHSALDEGVIKIIKPGIQKRVFIHPFDVTKIFVQDKGYGEIFDLGNPSNEVTILELARKISNSLLRKGVRNVVKLVEPPEGYDDCSRILNIGKLQKTFDCSFEFSLDDIIEESVSYELRKERRKII